MIDLPDRRVDPEVYDHEIVDQLLHLPVRPFLLRENALRVGRVHGALRHFLHRLPENSGALLHLLHPDIETREHIAVVIHRDIKIELFINKIGLIAAQVVPDSGCPEHGAGQPEVDRIFL